MATGDQAPLSAAEKFAPKIPPAVLRAAAEADERLRQITQPPPVQNGDGEAHDDQVDPGEGEGGQQQDQKTPPSVPGAPPPVSADGNVQPQPKVEPHPYSKPKEGQPAPKAPGEGEAEGDDWKHRYDSMKGRYDRVSTQNQQLAERLSSLEGVLSTLQATGQAPAGEPAKPKEPPPRLITEEEENTYGADFLSVVGKKAREEVAAEFAELRAQNEQLQNQLKGVGGHIEQTQEQRMLDTLDRDVPDWKAMNTDQEFLDWLGTPDPYSGEVRHELLKKAYARHDAKRVVAFFTGFLNEVEATAPQAAVQPQPAGRALAPAKTPLAKFAAPGRAKSTAPSRPVEQSVWSSADIARFYADVSSGKFRGREAEKNQIEQDLFAAQKEGRVITR